MNDTTLINIIKENKKLICSIINKYTKYYEFDDLYQVSIIGIMKAHKNFKEEYNVKRFEKMILSLELRNCHEEKRELDQIPAQSGNSADRQHHLRGPAGADQ